MDEDGRNQMTERIHDSNQMEKVHVITESGK